MVLGMNIWKEFDDFSHLMAEYNKNGMKKCLMKKNLTRKRTENAYQNACDEAVGINYQERIK